MKSILITATGTGVGKTLVSSMLMAVHSEYRYWKPVQSGTSEVTDSETVCQLSECAKERILPERYRLREPLSPHLSARREGVTIEVSQLQLPTIRPLIVEGAGGVLVPLNDNALFVEAFKMWSLPTLLVCRSELGTINHSLLSCEALRSRGVPLLGALFVGPVNAENERSVERFGKLPVLGRIVHDRILDASQLQEQYVVHCSDLHKSLTEA